MEQQRCYARCWLFLLLQLVFDDQHSVKQNLWPESALQIWPHPVLQGFYEELLPKLNERLRVLMSA